MSSGNRGYVLFATVTALWIGAIVGGAESRCQSQQDAYSAYEAKADSKHEVTQFAAQRAWVPCLIERAIANPKAGESTNKEERDLMAQETTALWAFWMLVVSGIMAIITALGTMLLYKQIVLTREAVTDTGLATEAMLESNKIAITAQRAWIKIEEAKMTKILLRNNPERPDVGDYFSAEVTLRVRNVGNLPAKSVKFVPRLWINSEFQVSFEEWRQGWLRALEQVIGLNKRVTELGPILFPDDTQNFGHRLSTSSFPVKGTLKVDRNIPERVRIFATLIILYKIGDDDWRYTLTNLFGMVGKISDWVDVENKKMPDIIRLDGGDLAS